MIELFKYLIKGLWTVVKSPFIIACYAVCLAFGLVQYIYYEILALILFFGGKNLKDKDEKQNILDKCRKDLRDRLNPLKQKEESSNE